VVHPSVLPPGDSTYKYFKALRILPIKSWAILQYVAGIIASLIVFFVGKGMK
jgi:hypothetical protein